MLPSVRALATSLGVSPVLVSRVYRELAQDQLVFTKPGIGTFVADLSRIGIERVRESVQKSLRQIADMYVRQALSLRHPPKEIRDEFLRRLDHHASNSVSLKLALVGNFSPATTSYAQEIETILCDLDASVLPFLLSDLEANIDCVLEKMNGVALVVSVPIRLQQVRNLLEPYGYTVAAVAFQASPQTSQKLSAIPPSHNVGVVSTYPEFLQSLLEGVASYCLLRNAALFANLEWEDQVRDMLAKVDVVVYASGAEKVLKWLPDGVEAIEYLHAPEPSSVNRLRSLLA